MDAPRIDNVSISSRYQVYVPCIIVLPAAWNLDRRYRWYDYQFRSFQIRLSLTVVSVAVVDDWLICTVRGRSVAAEHRIGVVT
jgi:hypothetical protein